MGGTQKAIDLPATSYRETHRSSSNRKGNFYEHAWKSLQIFAHKPLFFFGFKSSAIDSVKNACGHLAKLFLGLNT